MNHAPRLVAILVCLAAGLAPEDGRADAEPLPAAPPGWKVELVAKAPEVLFPTAVVVAPDGTVFVGQDPMDMPGPPNEPIDSVVALRPDGRRTIFAEKLWAVMGLEWADDTLYVVHAPYLSAFRDTDGDGRADERIDLITGLGPERPGFNGINDHVASGIRLGMDGFLYIAVGDKGIPKGIGKDGTSIQLQGGGVIRIRPDGSDLEVLSTGERNPLSVALDDADEVFTYGNDDDSKRWPNSVTHHVTGGHFGYPYEFLTAPWRCLPVMGGEIGGAGAQAIHYGDDGLPLEYRGNLFACDWGASTVWRAELERVGGTYRVASKLPFIGPGGLADFRPFSIAASPDGRSLYLVDWAYNGWLADGVQTGRLFRLTYEGSDATEPAPRPAGGTIADRIIALDHPARTARLDAQRALARLGPRAFGPLATRLGRREGPATGRVHAIWALDAIGTPEAREAIASALADPEPAVRLQAARSIGIREDRDRREPLAGLLRDSDAAVRREAAIALGRLGDPAAAPGLLAALGDPDPFADWSVRRALRDLRTWDRASLVEALTDPRRRESALRLTDEVWSVQVVDALIEAIGKTPDAAERARIVANLAGLYRRYPEWSGRWWGTNPLAGRMPQKTRAWSPEGMARVASGLIGALDDADPAVRLAAAGGLRPVGPPAAPSVRKRLGVEADAAVLIALIDLVGEWADPDSAPLLATLLADARRPLPVRRAALDGLGRFAGPVPLRARFALVYDAQAPPDLIARALPALGQAGALPANDLATFLDRAEPKIRIAALAALASRSPLPPEAIAAVVARLDDPAAEVRRAAVLVSASAGLREAVPRLLRLAEADVVRSEAIAALAALPDPRALPVYLAALDDRNPEARRAAERALRSIRDEAAPTLEARARAGRFDGPAAEAVDRVLTRFRPLTAWKVIGPFPRTTAQVFIGEPAIDFARTHAGAGGASIAWRARPADPATGRVVLDDLKAGAGDRGGFGYDESGSPDLAAFGYAEFPSDRDRDAWLLLGSSGPLLVTLNEQVVHQAAIPGRAFAPDSDRVEVRLRRGSNRLLLQTRQGIGAWTFGVQVSEPSALPAVADGAGSRLETLRAYALSGEGDPARGRALFFDANGVGCAKCHKVAGQGTSDVGPDLAGLAAKYDQAEIVRSVLEPSTRIANGYQTTLIATDDGRVWTGLVRDETDAHLDLIDAEGRVARLPAGRIAERRAGEASLMPADLVDGLTPEEFADLIAYLQGLRAEAAGP